MRSNDGGVHRQQLLGLNPPVTCGDSPPSSGALGISQSLTSLPRPPLLGAVASRRDDGGVHRQQLLGLNPPVTCGDSPPSSGALGISQSLTSLPRPPLLGAVASRRDDGGVHRQQLLGLNPPVTCGDSPPNSGALGISQSLTSLPRPPLVGNNDDRRQWRKQGGVVGAAASRTRVLCTMWTLGAATRTGGIPKG